MDSISKNMLLEIAYKLPVKALRNLALIGFNRLFNERFWQKYCVKRNIVLSTYPWTQRAYLWEKRRPVWTILDETPWDPDSQNPKFIWGLDDNQVIEYGESEIANAIVLDDIADVIGIHRDTDSMSGSDSTRTGFYIIKCIEGAISFENNGKLIEKVCKIVCFIRYCPYDQCHVGYCIINGNNWAFNINRSLSYSGEVKNGLRQGHGILTFENGFIINSEDLHNGIPWDDNTIIDSNIGETEDLADMSLSMIDRLSQIMEKYIYWCSHVGIFNYRESI